MSAPVSYTPGFIHDGFAALDTAIGWVRRRSAREEAYYAESDTPYTYGRNAGALTYRPVTAWPEILARVKAAVEQACAARFELLFCNRYADARQHLGWHADDSPMLDTARPIAVVSLGAAREIWFRASKEGAAVPGAPLPVERLLLESGSLLVMHPGCQQTHQHRIPKCDRECTPRLSLTFRGLAP